MEAKRSVKFRHPTFPSEFGEKCGVECPNTRLSTTTTYRATCGIQREKLSLSNDISLLHLSQGCSYETVDTEYDS